MSTHNLCFRAEIRKKNGYPCTLQFHNIKVGCKGVYITQTCYPDGLTNVAWLMEILSLPCGSEVTLSSFWEQKGALNVLHQDIMSV